MVKTSCNWYLERKNFIIWILNCHHYTSNLIAFIEELIDDGYNYTNFLIKCDGVKPAFIIIETVGNKVCGGYTCAGFTNSKMINIPEMKCIFFFNTKRSSISTEKYFLYEKVKSIEQLVIMTIINADLVELQNVIYLKYIVYVLQCPQKNLDIWTVAHYNAFNPKKNRIISIDTPLNQCKH